MLPCMRVEDVIAEEAGIPGFPESLVSRRLGPFHANADVRDSCRSTPEPEKSMC